MLTKIFMQTYVPPQPFVEGQLASIFCPPEPPGGIGGQGAPPDSDSGECASGDHLIGCRGSRGRDVEDLVYGCVPCGVEEAGCNPVTHPILVISRPCVP